MKISLQVNIYYRLKQIDLDGSFKYSDIIEVEVNNMPVQFSLEQNYPNPFNPITTINFTIPKEGLVTITIYNAIGQEIQKLVNEIKQSGNYTLNFDALSLPGGIYFYRMHAGNFLETKKMILLK